MPLPIHFRKDSPAGITAPNPDCDVDLIGHITKHRGMKTPFTSVSERIKCLKHFSGELYSVQPDRVVADGHGFQTHAAVLEEITRAIQSQQRAGRVLAQRAFQYAESNREAIIRWQFDLTRIERKDRISWCGNKIQGYFSSVRA